MTIDGTMFGFPGEYSVNAIKAEFLQTQFPEYFFQYSLAFTYTCHFMLFGFELWILDLQ